MKPIKILLVTDSLLKHAGLYRIVHHPSGKVYVGSTNNIYRRYHEHVNRLNRSSHSSAKLQRAWDKYDASEFSFEVILFCEFSECIRYEKYLLSKLDFAQCFNTEIEPVQPGCKRVFSEEHRAKISAYWKGRSKTPEQIEKHRKSIVGRKQTAESIAKRAAAMKGKPGGMLGKKHSPETKLKMSEAKKTPEAIENMRRAQRIHIQNITQNV